MDVTFEGREGYSVVRVIGRIDADSYTKFGLALSAEYDRGIRHLLLDLSKVSYMNSAGLRELVSTARLLRQEDGDVILLTPSKRVADVLEITGIGAIFSIISDESAIMGLII